MREFKKENTKNYIFLSFIFILELCSFFNLILFFRNGFSFFPSFYFSVFFFYIIPLFFIMKKLYLVNYFSVIDLIFLISSVLFLILFSVNLFFTMIYLYETEPSSSEKILTVVLLLSCRLLQLFVFTRKRGSVVSKGYLKVR